MPISAKEARTLLDSNNTIELEEYIKDLDEKILAAVGRGHAFTQITIADTITFPTETYSNMGYTCEWQEIPKLIVKHKILHLSW